jgi:hypothetical protein
MFSKQSKLLHISKYTKPVLQHIITTNKTMRRYSMKSISLVSQLPYLGNTGSGSVSGYYTIWSAKLDDHGQLTGQPTPRKFNQTIDDLARFKGTLYEYDAEVYPVNVKECGHCKELALIPIAGTLCSQCEYLNQMGELHAKQYEA